MSAWPADAVHLVGPEGGSPGGRAHTRSRTPGNRNGVGGELGRNGVGSEGPGRLPRQTDVHVGGVIVPAFVAAARRVFGAVLAPLSRAESLVADEKNLFRTEPSTCRQGVPAPSLPRRTLAR